MAPLLTDAFHFIFQSGALLKRQNAAEILQVINDLRKEKWMNDLIRRSGVDISLHLRLYLIVNCAHYLDVYSQEECWNEQTEQLINTWSDVISILLAENKDLSPRQLLVMDLFDHIRERQYAALKWPGGFPEELPLTAAIQLCIEKDDLPRMDRFLSRHPFARKLRRRALSFKQSYNIATSDGTELSLDLFWNFKNKTVQVMDAADLLSSAVESGEGIRIPGLEMGFAHIWLSYILDGTSMPEIYQQKFMKLPEFYRDKLNIYFKKEWKSIGLLHYAFALDQSSELTASVIQHLQVKKYNRGFSGLSNRLGFYFDKLVYLFSGTSEKHPFRDHDDKLSSMENLLEKGASLT